MCEGLTSLESRMFLIWSSVSRANFIIASVSSILPCTGVDTHGDTVLSTMEAEVPV